MVMMSNHHYPSTTIAAGATTTTTNTTTTTTGFVSSAGAAGMSTPTTATPAFTTWPNFVSPTSSGASQVSTTSTMTVNKANSCHPKRYRGGEGKGEGGDHHHHHQPPPYSSFPQDAALGSTTWHGATPAPPTAVIPNINECSKRRRAANYVPPRQVPKTVTSSMGSVAARGALGGGTAGATNLRVHLRQQLSGSNLMEFLGNHDDKMDVAEDSAHDQRPRSMSF